MRFVIITLSFNTNIQCMCLNITLLTIVNHFEMTMIFKIQNHCYFVPVVFDCYEPVVSISPLARQPWPPCFFDQVGPDKDYVYLKDFSPWDALWAFSATLQHHVATVSARVNNGLNRLKCCWKAPGCRQCWQEPLSRTDHHSSWNVPLVGDYYLFSTMINPH